MTTEGLGTRATWGSAASLLTAGTVGSTHTVLNGSVKPRGFDMLKLKARPCFHLQRLPCGSYKELLWQNYALYRKRDGAHETGHGLKKRAFLRM